MTVNDPTKVTVQCSGETDDGTQCDRELTVHVHRKFRDHYCHNHSEGES
jgi:hypothetical protein